MARLRIEIPSPTLCIMVPGLSCLLSLLVFDVLVRLYIMTQSSLHIEL